MCPDIESEVLKTIGVVGAVHAVEGSVASELVVTISVVIDVVLAESWDVVEAVDQVGSPEDETVALADVPALRTHLGEHTALDKAGWADDGLQSCVLATIVATPGCTMVRIM